MGRRLVAKSRGFWVAEFPFTEEGQQRRSRKGPRRNLIKVDKIAHLDADEQKRILYDLYQKKLSEFQQETNKQKWQIEKTKQETRTCTVQQALDRWVKSIRAVNRELTVKDYQRSINLYIKLIEDHRLSEFTLDHNYAFIEALKKHTHRGRKLSDTTINKHVRHLGVFLKWAYDNDIVKKEHNLKNVRLKQKDMDTVDVDTIHHVIDETLKRVKQSTLEIDRQRYKNLLRAMMIAKTSLLRVGAIWSLQLQNIDMRNRLICIRSVPELNWESKSFKEPNKPINDELFEFLEEDLKARNPEERWYLDKGNGEQWRKDCGDISRETTELLKDLGIEKIKPFHHLFRASMLTEIINAGVDLHVVQELADHSSITTTMKYSDSRRINQRKAVDAIPRKPKNTQD